MTTAASTTVLTMSRNLYSSAEQQRQRGRQRLADAIVVFGEVHGETSQAGEEEVAERGGNDEPDVGADAEDDPNRLGQGTDRWCRRLRFSATARRFRQPPG